jgi:hypothetical protein
MRFRIVLDSDGLIKLAKAGLLQVVLAAWDCLVPRAVYVESIERGMRLAHPDAAEIHALLRPGSIRPRARHPRATAILRGKPGLGPGECEALHLYVASEADALVTDDAAFLDVLTEADIPALPPALAILVLQEQGHLNARDAVAGLERLRPFIRPEVYRAARTDLDLTRPGRSDRSEEETP